MRKLEVVCKATWLTVSVLTPSRMSISPPAGQLLRLAVQKAGHDPHTLLSDMKEERKVRLRDVGELGDDEHFVERVFRFQSDGFAT